MLFLFHSDKLSLSSRTHVRNPLLQEDFLELSEWVKQFSSDSGITQNQLLQSFVVGLKFMVLELGPVPCIFLVLKQYLQHNGNVNIVSCYFYYYYYYYTQLNLWYPLTTRTHPIQFSLLSSCSFSARARTHTQNVGCIFIISSWNSHASNSELSPYCQNTFAKKIC